MTIERGGDWGRRGALPAGAPCAASDAAVRELVEGARRDGSPLPVIGLLGGDLCRSLGGRGSASRLAGDDATTLEVDVVRASIEGTDHWFVAHLLAATLTWAQVTLVMNAEHRGRYDVAPRAHPGDGTVDVVTAALPVGQRLEARRRARTGSHLPHPGIEVARASSVELEFARPRAFVLDGIRAGRSRRARLEVEAAALTVVV